MQVHRSAGLVPQVYGRPICEDFKTDEFCFYPHRINVDRARYLYEWLCELCVSVRSSHHLSVADSSPVSRLEQAAAAAAGTQRGDQQKTAGAEQRKATCL